MEIFRFNNATHYLLDINDQDPYKTGVVKISPTHHSSMIGDFRDRVTLAASRNFGYSYHYDKLSYLENGTERFIYQFLKRRLGSGEIVARSEIIETDDETRKLLIINTIYRDVDKLFLDNNYALELAIGGDSSNYYQPEDKILRFEKTLSTTSPIYSSNYMIYSKGFLYYMNNELKLVKLDSRDLSYVETIDILSYITEAFPKITSELRSGDNDPATFGITYTLQQLIDWFNYDISNTFEVYSATYEQCLGLDTYNDKVFAYFNHNRRYYNPKSLSYGYSWQDVTGMIYGLPNNIILTSEKSNYGPISFSVTNYGTMPTSIHPNPYMGGPIPPHSNGLESLELLRPRWVDIGGGYSRLSNFYIGNDYGLPGEYENWYWQWYDYHMGGIVHGLASQFRFNLLRYMRYDPIEGLIGTDIYTALFQHRNGISQNTVIEDVWGKIYLGLDYNNIHSTKFRFTPEDLAFYPMIVPGVHGGVPNYYFKTTYETYLGLPIPGLGIPFVLAEMPYVENVTQATYEIASGSTPSCPDSPDDFIQFHNKVIPNINKILSTGEDQKYDPTDNKYNKLILCDEEGEVKSPEESNFGHQSVFEASPLFIKDNFLYFLRYGADSYNTVINLWHWYKYDLDNDFTMLLDNELPIYNRTYNGFMSKIYNKLGFFSMTLLFVTDFFSPKKIEKCVADLKWSLWNSVFTFNIYKRMYGLSVYDGYDDYSSKNYFSSMNNVDLTLRDSNEIENIGIIFDSSYGGYIFHKDEEWQNYVPRLNIEGPINKPYTNGAMCSDINEKYKINNNDLISNFYRNKLCLLEGYDLSMLDFIENKLLCSESKLVQDALTFDNLKYTNDLQFIKSNYNWSSVIGYNKGLVKRDNLYKMTSPLLSCCLLNYWQSNISQTFNSQGNKLLLVESFDYDFNQEDIDTFNSDEKPLVLPIHFNEIYLIQFPYIDNLSLKMSSFGTEGIKYQLSHSIIYIPSLIYDDISYSIFDCDYNTVILSKVNGDMVLSSKPRYNFLYMKPECDIYFSVDPYFKGFLGKQLNLFCGNNTRFFVTNILESPNSHIEVMALGRMASSNYFDDLNYVIPMFIPTSIKLFGNITINNSEELISYSNPMIITDLSNIDIIASGTNIIKFYIDCDITSIKIGDEIFFENPLNEIYNTSCIKLFKDDPDIIGYQGFGINTSNVTSNYSDENVILPINLNRYALDTLDVTNKDYDGFLSACRIEKEFSKVYKDEEETEDAIIEDCIISRLIPFLSGVLLIVCDVSQLEDPIDADLDKCNLKIFYSDDGKTFNEFGILVENVPIQKVGLLSLGTDAGLSYFDDTNTLILGQLTIDNIDFTFNFVKLAEIKQSKFTQSIEYVNK